MAPLKTTTLEYFGSGVMAKLVVFLFQKCDIPKWLEPLFVSFLFFQWTTTENLGNKLSSKVDPAIQRIKSMGG